MDKNDLLNDYIKDSELRELSSEIKIRLSKDLVEKYDQGLYKNYLAKIQRCYELIKKANISYPNNNRLILYIYIVPDENYAEMLKIPDKFNNGKGGGKPVKSYDKDSFYYAYGVSQNRCENQSERVSIMNLVNNVHELAHLVHGEFFKQGSVLGEGFAETLSLYTLDLEEKFDEYIEALKQIKENQIYTVQELINQERDNTFGKEALLPNKSCSFRLSYISSYLFVRGLIETIEEKQNLSKQEATQHLLEKIRQSKYNNEWLIFDIADQIDIEKEELLNAKELQIETLDKIINKKHR